MFGGRLAVGAGVSAGLMFPWVLTVVVGGLVWRKGKTASRAGLTYGILAFLVDWIVLVLLVPAADAGSWWLIPTDMMPPPEVQRSFDEYLAAASRDQLAYWLPFALLLGCLAATLRDSSQSAVRLFAVLLLGGVVARLLSQLTFSRYLLDTLWEGLSGVPVGEELRVFVWLLASTILCAMALLWAIRREAPVASQHA